MSQPVDSSQDLVDFEDMTPVPSPAKSRETGGVPTPGRAGAPSQANAAPPSVAAPDGNRGVRVSPDALAMDADAVAGEEADAVAAADGGVSRPARPDDVPDEEMRDQHTFVPLEPEEVRLAERICRRVDEPKKHLVRLLVAAFGAALAEGALRETERAFEADRRRRQKTASRRKTTTTTAAATRRTSDEDDVRPAEDIDMSDSREGDPKEGDPRESDLVYFDPGDGGPPRAAHAGRRVHPRLALARAGEGVQGGAAAERGDRQGAAEADGGAGLAGRDHHYAGGGGAFWRNEKEEGGGAFRRNEKEEGGGAFQGGGASFRRNEKEEGGQRRGSRGSLGGKRRTAAEVEHRVRRRRVTMNE